MSLTNNDRTLQFGILENEATTVFVAIVKNPDSEIVTSRQMNYAQAEEAYVEFGNALERMRRARK
jgi:hypothetical protein